LLFWEDCLLFWADNTTITKSWKCYFWGLFNSSWNIYICIFCEVKTVLVNVSFRWDSEIRPAWRFLNVNLKIVKPEPTIGGTYSNSLQYYGLKFLFVGTS
jgi:hypothetical protein